MTDSKPGSPHVKPEPAPAVAETRQITIVNQLGSKTSFVVPVKVKFRRIADKYAERIGKPVSSIRFTIHGERFSYDGLNRTLDELDLQDGDTVEEIPQQDGGQ